VEWPDEHRNEQVGCCSVRAYLRFPKRKSSESGQKVPKVLDKSLVTYALVMKLGKTWLASDIQAHSELLKMINEFTQSTPGLSWKPWETVRRFVGGPSFLAQVIPTH
jgi:hypothetical protein